MSRSRDAESFVRTVDEVVGGMLTCVTGKQAGRPTVDSALGDLVRWTGLTGKRDRRVR
jgi:hypothetical protein